MAPRGCRAPYVTPPTAAPASGCGRAGPDESDCLMAGVGEVLGQGRADQSRRSRDKHSHVSIVPWAGDPLPGPPRQFIRHIAKFSAAAKLTQAK